MKKFTCLTTTKHTVLLLLLGAIVGMTGLLTPGGVRSVAAQDTCEVDGMVQNRVTLKT